MGRKKNEVIEEDEVNTGLAHDVEEAEQVVESAKKPVKESYKITASFKAFDENEQVKIKCVFTGEGASVQEALEDVKNEETGESYPQGINALVVVKAKKGSNVIEKAVAPHRARALFENKDVALFNRIFNGL